MTGHLRCAKSRQQASCAMAALGEWPSEDIMYIYFLVLPCSNSALSLSVLEHEATSTNNEEERMTQY